MSRIYNVNSTCLRYVVPFLFEGSFEDAFDKVEKQKKIIKGKEKNVWVRRKVDLNGTESDLYSYIRNEFCFDDDNDNNRLSDNKTGCEWLFWRSGETDTKDGKAIIEVLYYPEGIKKEKEINTEEWEIPKGWKIEVSNVGLALFRNGLGIMWYELKLPTNNINSEQLMVFQNRVRELNRGSASLFWEETRDEPDNGIILYEINGITTYIRPFMFGKWVDEIIGFLNVRYFAERKSSYLTMKKNSMTILKGLKNRVISKDVEKLKVKTYLPDKAILFTYVSLGCKNAEDLLMNKYSYIFHISNGYNDSYHFCNDIANEIKRPFNDTYWYATQEGVAYITWTRFDNKDVFNKLIPSKIRNDYFSLFIKVLYQSFSLLIYAEKIQAEISAKKEINLEDPFNNKISELSEEINLFLTKSMATSVSHIHHQSEFYIYLKKQLRVHEDVKSITAGLDSLDGLQREQRQREENKRVQKTMQVEQQREQKIQTIMNLLALLGSFSVIVDVFDLISMFNYDDGKFWSYSFFMQGIIIVVDIIIIVIILIAVRFNFTSIRRKKDNDQINEKRL